MKYRLKKQCNDFGKVYYYIQKQGFWTWPFWETISVYRDEVKALECFNYATTHWQPKPQIMLLIKT